MILVSAFLAVPALAAGDTSENVLKVARMNITMYGFYRIGSLGEAHGGPLTEKQICGLAGRAAASFEIFQALGLNEKDIEIQLGGLAEFGITPKLVQDTLTADNENCTN